jgi:hypothetical protein
MLRIDYIFSYWIVVWYILYICNFIKYNPKFVIILGLLENICILLLMFYYNTKPRLIFLFFIMMFLIKIIPLYTIWNTKITINDIYFSLFVIIVYLLWMFINKKNTTDFINNSKKLIIYNKNTLPGMILLDKLKIRFYEPS